MPNVATFARDDSGQGLVEYALIIAILSILAVSALRALGTKSGQTLNKVGKNGLG